MISFESAEKIAKSRYKFSITLLIAVGILSGFVVKLMGENKDIRRECEKEYLRKDSLYRSEIHRVSEDLKNCEARDRISSDNAIKAAQKDADDYKKLYIKMLELKAQAQQKNIIR